MAAPLSIPPWSELPQDLLGLIIDRLPQSSGDDHGSRFSAARSRVLQLLPFAAAHRAHFREMCLSLHSAWLNCARFRAVCRSWKAALHEHIQIPRLTPMIILSDGSFLTHDGTDPLYRLPSLPKGARCIGSTDEWLALDCIDAQKKHRYSLHNPFSNTTVPLTELDDVIGNVSKLFKVRKVLMWSTPEDVITVMTNNWNYPIILTRPGKGAWLPMPRTAPYGYIIDIAFLGDKLYGITQAEDLVCLGISFDRVGIPIVTSVDRVIRHSPMEYNFSVWSDDDDLGDEGEDDYGNEDGAMREEDDERRVLIELMKSTGDGMIFEPKHWWYVDEVPYEPKDFMSVTWHFVESCGKLLMVRRQVHWSHHNLRFTCKVEVLEADAGASAWVPVAGGLGGQALFISGRFCKSVSGHEKIEGDVIYFIDTGEKFNMRTQVMTPTHRVIDHKLSTWIFMSNLVA